jgi:colanic acid biosynthesis protein WcaH
VIKPLPLEDFRFVVRTTNIFALDLIIEDSEGKVLIGLRNNPPAQGFWFVPGGRVYKNEPLRDALSRILRDETGFTAENVVAIALHGLYEHIYDDNVFCDPSFNTHYVVGACRVTLTGGTPCLADSQHKLLRFVSVADLQVDPLVHQFVKFYFMANPPNRFL